MKNKIIPKISLMSLIGLFISAVLVRADDIVNTDYDIALGTADPAEVAVSIINWGLGILGIIAVIIILYGGFVWMFSQGDEEKINKAKAIIKNAVIGLAIILFSWGIATFIINKLLIATDAGGSSSYTVPGSYTYSNGNPFYIDHSNPAKDDIDVSLCHLIAVTFSLPIEQSSINENTFKVTLPSATDHALESGKSDGESCQESYQCLSSKCDSETNQCVGDQLAGSYSFSEEPSYIAVWYPEADYLASETYKVELTTSVTGVDEVTIDTYNLDLGDSKRIFEFTTGTTTDEIPPKVDLQDVVPYPADEEEEICRNTAIQVTFSESLDPISVTDENVRLYDYTDEATEPNDGLKVSTIKFSSIGNEADDTFLTSPEETLEAYSWYGLSLYSGYYDETIESIRDNFEGAIKDTCGNPLSGDFDNEMEGSPTDDFTESTSAGADNGWDHQWTFKTGEETECVPDIESIYYDPVPAYYSEDTEPFDEADETDTNLVTISGDYLYPFSDVEFFNNISTNGETCFDQSYTESVNCFVSGSSQEVVVRTPVGSQSGGRIHVEDVNGNSDASDDYFEVASPYIRNLSPEDGPVEQFVTIKGENFGDYDPNDEDSVMGEVYFDDVKASLPCVDGWDDDEIIVQVPVDFSVDDFPAVQIITAEQKYSNNRGFEITDGEPGPGLCALDPSCSNAGLDDIYVIGQNFPEQDKGVVYFSTYLEATEAGVNASGWDIDYNGDLEAYSGLYDEYRAIYTSSPVSAQDDYDVVVGTENDEGEYDYSNSLNFDIPCQETPELFYSNDCDLEDTFYLPNPRAYEDEACRNGVIMMAFTADMDDDGSNGLGSVEDLIEIKQCGSGEDYLADECVTDITDSGDWTHEFLDSSYFDGEEMNYEAFTFSPNSNLLSGTWYSVYIPETVSSENGVMLDQPYSWHFKVRSDDVDCSVDAVNLKPNTHRETLYQGSDYYPQNYQLGEEYYSFKANSYNSDCFAINNNDGWYWEINNIDANIIKFNEADSFVASQETEIGYNRVYLQGDAVNNDGTAYVTAGVNNEEGYPDLSEDGITYNEDPNWVYDTSPFIVDYGYCEDDGDCVSECPNSICDATTSHCTPEITSVSPTETGPGSCVTLSGCFFGTTREPSGTCTCTQVDTNQVERSCEIIEGYSYCLLSNSEYCYLDESETVCEEGLDNFVAPVDGSVFFGEGNEANYLDDDLCAGYQWTNSEVIVQLPETAANEITLTSYNDLSDVYGDEESEIFAIGDEQTPCLCRVEPSYGREQSNVTLYGKYFDVLNTESRVAEFSEFNKGYYSTGTWTELAEDPYGLDAWQIETTVAEGANYNEEREENGVRVTDTSINSNVMDFKVTCNSNNDCSSGCCEDGMCKEAEDCNDCANKTDCSYEGCNSACIEGMCEPYINAVNPDKGDVGQPVTISGCHFGSYYDADTNILYSKATFNDIEAEFACGDTESWNNQEIKVVVPDNIFIDTNEADVDVTQVYTATSGELASQESGTSQPYCANSACDNETDCEDDLINGGCESQWYTSAFVQDQTCTDVDIPVLCDIEDYPYAAQGGLVDLEGYYFYDNAILGTSGLCTCEGEYGVCDVNQDESSCDIDYSETCYVDAADTEAACNDEVCPCEGEYGSCDISLSESSCDISGTETCYVDADAIETTCTNDIDTYVETGGSVSFAVNQDASWQTYVAGATNDIYDVYENTEVPTTAESGNVYVAATQYSDGEETICKSNTMNFDITCGSCSDCTDGDEGDIMCNLASNDFDDQGICTTSKTGFCEEAPESCCGNTGCKVDVLETCLLDEDEICEEESGCICESETSDDYCIISEGVNSCDITDGGTCIERPLFLDEESLPQNGATGVCANAEITIDFDSEMTTSDGSDYANYIKLKKGNEDVEINVVDATGNSLILTQSQLLEADTEYHIIINSDPNTNEGLVDTENGLALGCDEKQEQAGICVAGEESIITTFTVDNEGVGCHPDYVDLSASNEDFLDAAYTFISAEQEENFIATVYSSPNDEILGNDDDQAITPIAGVLDWSYQWSPQYESLEDLETSQCPIIAILTGTDGDFEEDKEEQTITSSSSEGEAWVSVIISADSYEENGWEGSLDASQFVRVLFCDSETNLYAYSDDEYNSANSQNFYFAYCRSNDNNEDLLPSLEDPIIKRGSDLDEEFIVEYLFNNADNDDKIGVIVYNNGLDNAETDTNILDDVVNPGLWADLRLDNFGNYSQTTLDEYEAVENDYNILVSAPKLQEATSTLYPNVYMISISKDASEETIDVFNVMKEYWSFNTNDAFAPQPANDAESEDLGCQVTKDKLIRDTDRVTDLGSFNYYLAKYYYLDSDGDDTEDYPGINDGSYIQYITNSIWPSWDSVLGNDLGRSLETDVYNEFVSDGCPYDENNNKFYDENGTCWDPVNKDYYCPDGSYLYQYNFDSTNNGYNLYANLELEIEDWDWGDTTVYNPCADNEYSDSGCACFNYQVSSSGLNDFYYGTCGSETVNKCDSNSGFKTDLYCEDDSDCQIVE